MTDQTPEDKRINRIAVNVFLLVLALYTFTFSGFGYITDSGHERIALVKSIVERHEVSLSGEADLKGTDGKLYPLRGIAPALLSVPFFSLGKMLGVSGAEGSVAIINQLFGAATVAVVFLFSFSFGCSLKASLLTAIFYGLGTFAWPYSKISFEHTIETFFVLFSVYCMHRYTLRGNIKSILISGISFGVAFNTRYTSVLILPALLLIVIMHYLKKSVKGYHKYVARDAVFFCFQFFPFWVCPHGITIPVLALFSRQAILCRPRGSASIFFQARRF
jgi:4-amino-4-deoxy-L-arabinose transferase-like glycosyltransferase